MLLLLLLCGIISTAIIVNNNNNNNSDLYKASSDSVYDEQNNSKSDENEIVDNTQNDVLPDPISERTLVGIGIKTLPNKLEYIKGEKIDLSGGVITLFYNDNTRENKKITMDMIKINKLTEVGMKNVIVKYKNFTTGYNINVINNNVKIDIEKMPKIKYAYNEELDVTGGQIIATKQNGETEIINMTNEMILDYVKTSIGAQTLTVKYDNLTTKFNIEVINYVGSIKITNMPKQIYIYGEDLDLTGGQITATRLNGEVEKPVNITEDMITGYNPNLVGRQNLTISYENTTCILEVTVKNVLLDIEIAVQPAKTDYIEKQNFNKAGMRVIAKFIDESERDVTGQIVIKNGQCLQIGQPSVTIEYTFDEVKKEAEQEITVVPKSLDHIEIASIPTKDKYIKGTEDLDLTGGAINLVYDNEEVELKSMTDDGVEVTDFDNTEEGIITLTVNYEGKTNHFNVEITNYVVETEVTTLPRQAYFIGQELDLKGGVITATKQNHEIELVGMTSDEVKVTGYRPWRMGTQCLTVKYKGVICHFNVTVIVENISIVGQNVNTEETQQKADVEKDNSLKNELSSNKLDPSIDDVTQKEQENIQNEKSNVEENQREKKHETDEETNQKEVNKEQTQEKDMNG